MGMSQRDTPAFAGNTGDPHIALSPFGHSDGDFVFDLLSTNRRLPDHPDLPVLGTVVLAGPTADTIHVMISDCLVPPVGPDSRCPECDRSIRVNMARHLRLCHTTYICFWRCPVSTCPLWFTSELNGKDHIERTHRFCEGRGCSFYECLRTYDLEWFGSRSFLDQQHLHHHTEPGVRPAQALLHSSSKPATARLRRSTGAIKTTAAFYCHPPTGDNASGH